MKNATQVTRAGAALAGLFAMSAATAAADTLCFTRNGQAVSPLLWGDAARWFTQSGGSLGAAVGRVPTTADTVNLWGGNLADPAEPLRIPSGTAAETGDFVVGQWAGGGAVTYLSIEGGSLTNAGTVRVGYHTDGTHAGFVTVSSGEWNVGGANAYVGQSKATSVVDVKEGGTLRQLAAGAVFDVGPLVGGSGVVTNAGTMALDSLHCGDRGDGAFVNSGSLSTATRLLVGGHSENNATRTGAGTFVNDGGSVTIGKSESTGVFVLGWNPDSSGTFVHKGGTVSFPRAETANSSYWPIVGRYGTGLFVVQGDLELDGSGWQLNIGSVSGGSGTLRVENGATMSGLRVLRAGAASGGAGRVEVDGDSSTLAYATAQIGSNNDKAVGRVALSGGTFAAAAGAGQVPLVVGRLATSAASDGVGEIRGWGKVLPAAAAADATADHRIQLRGQVVADGGGAERDLDLGLFLRTSDYATDPNPAGRTNGWYAVNKGRLLYPRREKISNASLVAIGDWPYAGTPADADRPDITLVNSLSLRVFDASGAQLTDGSCNFAALYAPDRADIPGAGSLPGSGSGEKTLGVWRIGRFSDSGDVGGSPTVPVAIDHSTLRIRYDAAALAAFEEWGDLTLGLWRWDGAAWTRIAKISGRPDASSPWIEASNIPAYVSGDASDNWNVGWFAVAATAPKPFVLVVR